MDIDVFRVKKPWIEGTKDGATAAAGESTWAYQSYNTSEWTAWGVDDAADREMTPDDTVTVSTEGEWYEWNVTDSLKYMFDHDEYYGWLLKWQLEDSFKRYRFWSSENGTAANSPYLEITYNNDPACGYAYKRAITIDHNDVIGDSGDTVDLVDFPVVIKESGTWLRNSSYTDGRIENSNGYDIIFKDSTETLTLAHEIEYYNAGSEAADGELVAWVKIPVLDANANTVIYMYYGNSCVDTETQNRNAVWNANYKMVQHLQETSGTHEDSTQNNNHSTSVTVTTQGSAEGKIDGADDFDGSQDGAPDPVHNVVIDDNANGSLDITEQITIEAWVTDNVKDRRRIVTKKGELYVLRSNNYTGRLHGYLTTDSGYKEADSVDNLILDDGAWHYCVFTWDGRAGYSNALYHPGFCSGYHQHQR